MKIIVGLGNPDKKYQKNRHNIGFNVLMDIFADDNFTASSAKLQTQFESAIFEGKQGEKYLMPQTFMNDSGRAVQAVINFYKIDVSKDLLVIHDDTDLPLGTIRATNSASSAGHNGVQDIIEKLGTQDFHRIRIGVESRASRNDMLTDAFVLQNFTADELKKLQDEVFPKVKAEIEKFLHTNQHK